MPTPAVQFTTRPPGWWSGSRGAAGAEAGGRPATKDGPAAGGVPAGEGPVSEDVRAGMKSEPVPSSITVTSLRPRLTPYHRPFQRIYTNIIASNAGIIERNRSRVREKIPGGVVSGPGRDAGPAARREGWTGWPHRQRPRYRAGTVTSGPDALAEPGTRRAPTQPRVR